MKNDFLFEALDNISDKHIEEAATYKSNVKAFPKKKAARIAACFAIILVCAVGAKLISDNVISKPPVTESTGITTQGAITGVPTDAGTYSQPDITAAPAPTESYTSQSTLSTNSTTACVPPVTESSTNEWELPPPLSGCTTPTARYGNLFYNGITYTSYGCRVEDESNCTKIADVVISSAEAEVFSIKEYVKDCCVAVRFKNLNDSSCYIYFNPNYVPENLGEYLSATGTEYIAGPDNDYFLYSKYSDGSVSKQRQSTGVAVYQGLQELLINGNKNAPCTRQNSIDCKNEMIYNKMQIIGIQTFFFVSDNGYFYIKPDGGNILAFEIGEENCKEFIEMFNRSSCDHDPEIGITIG